MNNRRSLLKLLPLVLAAPFVPTFGADELRSIDGIPVVWKDFRAEMLHFVRHVQPMKFLDPRPSDEEIALVERSLSTSFDVKGVTVDGRGGFGYGFHEPKDGDWVGALNEGINDPITRGRKIIRYEISSQLKNILKQSDFPS